ncbi:MAG: ATP-binding protein [Lentisphaeraceae bacterium]|nr:ATP-binding protein [Lentisphaeraceae bacterium]
MYRFAEQDLMRWFTKSRRKPLIIRGARQVGKSTIVRNFALINKITIHEVNLERHPRLDKLFKTSSTDNILQELSFIAGKGSIKSGKSLLFLDELQATPAAIPFLRYLYEEHSELDVVCAGSLLEFTLSDHSYSMPVGRVEYLFLGPMSFSECLIAHDDNDLHELIANYSDGYFPLAAHERLLYRFRDYLITGGMPEAVLASSEGEDYQNILDVQTSIIETYTDDFGKYGRGPQLSRLQTVFRHVPANLGKKVKYSQIDAESQARDLKPVIELLTKAGVLTSAFHCDANGLPLRAEIKAKVQKLYFLDVGLVNNLCGVHHIAMEELSSTSFINKGALAEQFVAQQLLCSGPNNRTPELNYWIREGKANNAEIDFIQAHNGVIYPIEVKAGQAGTMKSLHRFMYEKQCPCAVRFDLNPPSEQDVDVSFKLGNGSAQVAYKLKSRPVYMADFFANIVS